MSEYLLGLGTLPAIGLLWVIGSLALTPSNVIERWCRDCPKTAYNPQPNARYIPWWLDELLTWWHFHISRVRKRYSRDGGSNG